MAFFLIFKYPQIPTHEKKKLNTETTETTPKFTIKK